MINNMTQKVPVIYGVGAALQAGAKMRELGCTRVLFGFDSRTNCNGIVDSVRRSLLEAGLTLSDMDPCAVTEPSDVDVDKWAEYARSVDVDGVVALGGGSVIDLTKAVTGLITNKGSIRDYLYHRGVDPNMKKPIPLIAIPTTAGTGSEVSESAVITDTEHVFKSFFRFSARLAILDPVMTDGMPQRLTAETGMDAMSHLVETYLSTKANDKSDALAYYFIKEVVKWLPVAINEPKNHEARGAMLCAACFGGVNFNNVSLSMGHGIAHGIGAEFHLGHGLTCAFVFPEFLALCAGQMPEKVRDIGRLLGAEFTGGETPDEIGKITADKARDFLHLIGITSVRENGIERDSFIALAHHIYETNKSSIYNANTPCPTMSEADIASFLARTYDLY